MNLNTKVSRSFPGRLGGLLVVGAVVYAAVPAVAGTPQVRIKPLTGDREAIVVSVRPRAGVAVVAFPSGRLATVHAASLRGVTPGRRVRVEGVKWGTPTAGVKWARPPQGVKWGVKWSRSGVLQSRLRTIGPSRTARIRGIVVRRTGRGVAIGTPGGIVPVRVAVWLPGVKRTTARRLPVAGDTIELDVRFTADGRLMSTDGVRIVSTAGKAILPVSGRLAAVSTLRRTMTIRNIDDPTLPVEREIRVPGGVDLARLQVGREVASTSTFSGDGSLRAATIAPNDSFEASNDPANLIVAPPPASAATLDLVRRAVDRWVAAGTAGEVSDRPIYEQGLVQLQTADVAARDGDYATALTQLRAFNDLVVAGVPTPITPEVAADELALVNAAIGALVAIS